jgi:hypothetical protein
MQRFFNLLLSAFFLTACAGAKPEPSPLPPEPSATTIPSVTPTLLPTDSPTPAATPTATAVRTPPALPGVFKTSLLNPLDTPHTYIPDTCQYLQDKWSSTNSAPGTVLMPIMFHSITGDKLINSNQISETDFHALMQTLHDDGFQAINMAQAADFMEHNASIPARSVLLTVDDRHARAYFDSLFRTYWDQYHWPVINGWISTPLSSADLWQQQVDLEKEGWVDHQAHGVVHNTPMDNNVSDAYVTSELQGSIDAFKKYFDKTPIAIIWPGGGFSHRATLIARQLGYRLGFTITPRGPSMFNWVPLTDMADPARPYWAQDGYVNDPLLVLPRYWDTDAIKHLDDVMQIGKDAAAYAQADKAVELEYYDIVCAPKLGPMP